MCVRMGELIGETILEKRPEEQKFGPVNAADVTETMRYSVENSYRCLPLHLVCYGCCSCPSLCTDSVSKPDQVAGNGTSLSIHCSTAPHTHSWSHQRPVAQPVSQRRSIMN